MNGFFDDFQSRGLVKRELTFRGQTRDVWFREMTVGERLSIQRGLKFKQTGGTSEMELDYGDQQARVLQSLVFRLCKDEDGTPVWKNFAAFERERFEPGLIKALIDLMNDVNREQGEDAGNA